MTAVCFSSSVNLRAATYKSALHIIEGKHFLRYGYYIAILHRLRPLLSVRVLEDGNGVSWAADRLHMNYAFLLETRSFCQFRHENEQNCKHSSGDYVTQSSFHRKYSELAKLRSSIHKRLRHVSRGYGHRIHLERPDDLESSLSVSFRVTYVS